MATLKAEILLKPDMEAELPLPERLEQLYNAVFLLEKELEHLLQNLDASNVNSTEWQKVEAWKAQVERRLQELEGV